MTSAPSVETESQLWSPTEQRTFHSCQYIMDVAPRNLSFESNLFSPSKIVFVITCVLSAHIICVLCVIQNIKVATYNIFNLWVVAFYPLYVGQTEA